MLKMFNKPCGKKSYTPAELAKPYDINKYRTMLEDPDSDEMTRRTAEMMIKKYVIKLGALALAQEGKKGFPQGIPEVAKPYMQSVGLSDEDILPNDPNKQQQEEMSEENNIPQMPNDYSEPIEDQPDGTAPTVMPDGQPIAQPMPEEEMSPEMMQQAPMAMYGMSMGGYGLPFYNDPYEMRYGGLKQYDKGNEVKNQKRKSKEQLQKEIDEKKYKDKTQKVKKFEDDVEVFEVDGKKIGARGTIGGGQREYKKEGKIGKGDVSKFDKAKWEASICDRLKKGATVDEIAFSHGLNKEVIKSKWANCIKEGQQKYGEDNTQFFELESDCPCLDDKGQAIEGKFAQKDENGNCLPETCEASTLTVPGDECYCPDPNDPSKKIAVDCPEDGSEPDCGEGGGSGQYMGMQQPQGEFWPEWRQQDINEFNTVMNERHRKENPYLPSVDAPEFENIKKNWIGEVQAQLASEAGRTQQVRRSAGPASAKQAILTQMQSNPEGIIDRTNLENTGIENAEREANFGVLDRNMVNQGKLRKGYVDELSTVNQNWNNELNDWAARKTEKLNKGLTNAANTYNEQTDQYAIAPRTGIGIFKGGKKIKPEQSTSTLDKLMKYKQLYPGFDDKTLMAAIKMDSGNSGFTPADMMYGAYGGPVYMVGGQYFDDGGFVYGDIVYPFIL